jgi:hypothetical protein
MRSTTLLGPAKPLVSTIIPYDNVTVSASGNMSVSGSGTSTLSMFKTSGSNAWDNQVYCSTPYIAPCTIEFYKNAATTDNGVSYAMISWNADPLADASYSSLDQASYPYRTDNYSVYDNGSNPLYGGVWSPSVKFYLTYGTDGYIRHWNGSTLLYSANYGKGNTVYLDSSFYSPNATYGGFSSVRIIKLAWNGYIYV